jgi:hypothetical protein
LVGATRSPEIFCPDASLPENVKTGMVLNSSVSSLIPKFLNVDQVLIALSRYARFRRQMH